MSQDGEKPGDSAPPTSRSPGSGSADPLARSEEHVNGLFLAALCGRRAEREILAEVTEALRGVLERCKMPPQIRAELARAEALAATGVAVLDALQSSSTALVRGVVRRAGKGSP